MRSQRLPVNGSPPRITTDLPSLSLFAVDWMKRFVEGKDGGQSTPFSKYLDDWTDEDNPVHVIDVFDEELDLSELGFGGIDCTAAVTGGSAHSFMVVKQATSKPGATPSGLDLRIKKPCSARPCGTMQRSSRR
jgi:hypothetical protein